jgi:hypothetical protein
VLLLYVFRCQQEWIAAAKLGSQVCVHYYFLTILYFTVRSAFTQHAQLMLVIAASSADQAYYAAVVKLL